MEKNWWLKPGSIPSGFPVYLQNIFGMCWHWWLTTFGFPFFFQPVLVRITIVLIIHHAINKCFFIPILYTISFRCIKLAVNTLCMRNSASKCSAFCRIGHSPPSYIVRTVSSFVIANFLIETMKAINQIIQNFKHLFNSIAKITLAQGHSHRGSMQTTSTCR